MAFPLLAFKITMLSYFFNSFKASSSSCVIFLCGGLENFRISETFDRAIYTPASSRTLRKPASTPLIMSNFGTNFGVMAKLKPFKHLSAFYRQNTKTKKVQSSQPSLSCPVSNKTYRTMQGSVVGSSH